jgi:hypothetical protein
VRRPLFVLVICQPLELLTADTMLQ